MPSTWKSQIKKDPQNSRATQAPRVTHSPYRRRMRPRKKGAPFQFTAVMSQSMRLLSRLSRFQSRRVMVKVNSTGEAQRRSQNTMPYSAQMSSTRSGKPLSTRPVTSPLARFTRCFSILLHPFHP